MTASTHLCAARSMPPRRLPHMLVQEQRRRESAGGEMMAARCKALEDSAVEGLL